MCTRPDVQPHGSRGTAPVGRLRPQPYVPLPTSHPQAWSQLDGRLLHRQQTAGPGTTRPAWTGMIPRWHRRRRRPPRPWGLVGLPRRQAELGQQHGAPPWQGPRRSRCVSARTSKRGGPGVKDYSKLSASQVCSARLRYGLPRRLPLPTLIPIQCLHTSPQAQPPNKCRPQPISAPTPRRRPRHLVQ